jgi:hypothetical protein
MNIPTNRTGIYVVLLGVALIITGLSLASCQNSCGRKHDDAALVAQTTADLRRSLRGEYEQQLAGKDAELEQVKATAYALRQKYETARKKIPVAPLPPPVGEPALAASLKELGMGSELEVHIAVPSVLNVTDAQVVWNLGQEATRAKALDGALITCAEALEASEVVVKGQGEALVLSSKALEQSKLEADSRAIQAQELAKSLKVEKSKRWKLVAYPIAAAAITAWVVKK